MVDEKMFAQVIEAIEAGERSRAKDLLTRLLQADKRNPEQWLWMSSVVDSRKEQIYCLETVLRLDPRNAAAKRALVMLGEMDPGEGVLPVPPVRREWVEALGKVELEEKQERPPLGRGKLLAYAGAGIILLGLILAAIFIPQGRGIFQPKLTITPITWTPSPTAEPITPSPSPSPTPIPPGEASLSGTLEATYTPTPVYVNTPHPLIEAYLIGIRAYGEGDYEKMLIFMKQVAEQDKTADAYFYVGEAYRLLGQHDKAIQEYDLALEANPQFAPAYLGHALANLAQEPQAKVEDDLTQAIENDPLYGAAYIARAAYWLRWHEPIDALEDALEAENLLPESPYPYLYQAQALLALGEVEDVLSLAEKAQGLDVTLVDTYLIFGQMYMAAGDIEKALENLELYDTYASGKPLEYLIAMGQAYYLGEEYEEAIDMLTEALEKDDELLDALIYRGLAYVELGEFQKALSDTYTARELEPEVFKTGLALGRVFFATEEYVKAKAQFDAQEDRAENDGHLAQVYYWRALTLEELREFYKASKDWQALLDLPSKIVSEDWQSEAQEHLKYLLPTSSPTVTPSPMGSVTPTATEE